MSHFHDPAMVARYHEGPPRFVPGFADMQRMARVPLAERAPFDARVLVPGAGGGLELKAFADGQPGWTFDGVDPSAAMFELARQLVAAHGDRVRQPGGAGAAGRRGAAVRGRLRRYRRVPCRGRVSRLDLPRLMQRSGCGRAESRA